MSDTNFLAGQSSIWVQPDGPNTKHEYLGCHGIGDVDEQTGKTRGLLGVAIGRD